MMFAFEDLENLSLKELQQHKEDAALALHKERQKRWDCIAAILFYQDEIKKLWSENDG